MDYTIRQEAPSAVSDGEAEYLEQLAINKRVLEVGSHFGFSTIVMATVAESLVSVDYHRMDGDNTIQGGSFPRFLRNIENFELTDRVLMFIGESDKVLPLLRHESFDFIFIDGNHDYEFVASDIDNCLPLLRSGGLMAFHDYGIAHFGVQRAVDERFQPHKRVNQVYSLMVVLP